MFSTSILYFSVAIFGERIETSEAHGLQLAEGQIEGETTESGHNESQEWAEQQPPAQEILSETHNESGETTEQRLQEGLIEQGNETTPNQNETNESKNIEGDILKAKEQKKAYIKNQLLKVNARTWNFHSQLVEELVMLQ